MVWIIGMQETTMIFSWRDFVGQFFFRVMEEIPNNHLECIKPCK